MNRQKLNCGHYPAPGSLGNGIAYLPVPGSTNTNADALYTMCYACADQDARDYQLRVRPYAFLYQGSNDDVVSWTGGVMGHIIHRTKSTYRINVRVRDVNGRYWYGTGPRDWGTYLRLRPYRHQPTKEVNA